MVKIDTEELLSITDFAKVARITRQGVNKAIKEGRLKYVTISGHKFMHKTDVEKFRQR